MASDAPSLESIAKILIIDTDDTVLVLKLGKHLKYPEKSYLPDLPGGIVDPGESVTDALVREAVEECGIKLDPSSIRLVFGGTEYFEAEQKSVTKLLYVVRLSGQPSITLSWEHSAYSWVKIQELEKIDFRPFFNRAIGYVTDHLLIGRR